FEFLLMQWSTTVSLHDLHIIDDANSIVRWHRMSQCPVCLQPIPYGTYACYALTYHAR
ncbi:unnamed protein product, partial [Rotaria magnacalcarata]